MPASASASLRDSVLRNMGRSRTLVHAVTVPHGHGERQFLSDMEELFGEDHPISFIRTEFQKDRPVVTCEIHIDDANGDSYLARFYAAWRITTHYWLKTGYVVPARFPAVT